MNKLLSLRYQFVDKSNLRKKKCGCVEIKILTFGSTAWILYADGMCKNHLKEYLKDFHKQQKIRVDVMLTKQKKTLARKANKEKKKDDNNKKI